VKHAPFSALEILPLVSALRDPQSAHRMGCRVKIALYVRISTTDKGQSTENQSAQLRSWAAQQGHEIVEEYADQVSGSGKARRPAFERMMADAAQHKFQMLVFWSLDRLSREGVLATLQHLKRLDDCGVCWKSFTEQYLDSCGVFREAVLAILAAIAKQERVRISERVKAGLDTARAAGRRGGRKRSVPPETAQRIREMAAEGCTLDRISAQLRVARSTAHRIAREVERVA
jgi:DNA invertase Pin-like site-specific DNA recombinase